MAILRPLARGKSVAPPSPPPLQLPQLVCKHLFLYPLHWRHPFQLLQLAGVPRELLPRGLPPEEAHTFFKAGVSVFLDHTLLLYGDQGQLQELCELMSTGRAKFGGGAEDRGGAEGRGRSGRPGGQRGRMVRLAGGRDTACASDVQTLFTVWAGMWGAVCGCVCSSAASRPAAHLLQRDGLDVADTTMGARVCGVSRNGCRFTGSEHFCADTHVVRQACS